MEVIYGSPLLLLHSRDAINWTAEKRYIQRVTDNLGAAMANSCESLERARSRGEANITPGEFIYLRIGLALTIGLVD